MSERDEVKFSVEREGSRVVVAARGHDGQAATLDLTARGAGALAANLVCATSESGEGWEAEFSAKGGLEVQRP